MEDLDSPNIESLTFDALIGPKARLAQTVHDYLKAIKLFSGVKGKEPSVLKDQPPIFICVHENIVERRPDLADIDPWGFCQRRTDAWGFSDRRWRYVFLCERFWDPEHKVEPPKDRPESEACPRFEDNRYIDDDGDRLARFQKYLIIHELLHMYMPDGGLHGDSDPEEVYSLNECMRLDLEVNRLRNPNNIVYYVASTYLVQRGF